MTDQRMRARLAEALPKTRAAVTGGAPPTANELERRQNGWRLLLIVVAFVLLSETFMSTRGWRAVARRYRPVTPERSEP